MLDSRLGSFEVPTLHAALGILSDRPLDDLDFGVIGFDHRETVTRCNATESRLAAITRERVVGLSLRGDSGVAAGLNKRTVSEGIETGPQSQLMCELGSDKRQGYFCSRPHSAQAGIDQLCHAKLPWTRVNIVWTLLSGWHVRQITRSLTTFVGRLSRCARSPIARLALVPGFP